MTESDPPPSPARKPTPVRKALKRESPDTPSDPPPPSRVFEAEDGSRWRVEVGGRSATGIPSDPGAPLLLLVFTPLADEGDEPRDAVDRRELLVPARELDALSVDQLVELLGRSSELEFEPSDLFPGTRRNRHRG